MNATDLIIFVEKLYAVSVKFCTFAPKNSEIKVKTRQ